MSLKIEEIQYFEDFEDFEILRNRQKKAKI
jgi:hypothetical protein